MSEAAIATAPSTVHFIALMNAMRDHHKGASPGMFELSASPHFTAMMAVSSANFADAPPPPEVEALKADAVTQLQASSDATKTSVTDATTQLSADKDQNGFRAKMLAERDKTKQTNDAAIDDVFNKAISVGVAHPEMQPALTDAMNVVGTTVSTVVKTITDVITGVLGKITEILEGLLNGVTSFIESGFGEVASVIGAIL